MVPRCLPWIVGLAGALAACGQEGPPPHPLRVAHTDDVAHVLQTHCVDCHSGAEPEGDLDLTTLTHADASVPETVLAHADRWERIAQVVAHGDMPPEGAGEVPDDARAKLASWVDQAVDHAEATLPEVAGTLTLRRLNRAEYQATVRELLGVTPDVRDLLPPDDVGHGFDHLGEVLTLSPTHMDAYLRAAQHIAAQAVISVSPARPIARVFGPGELATRGRVSERGNGYYFSSRGTVTATTDIPRAGRYRVVVRAWAQQAGPEIAQMRIVGRPHPKGSTVVEVKAQHGVAQDYTLEVALPRGRQKLEASFINDYWNPKAKDRRQRDRNLIVQRIAVEGPLTEGLAPLPAETLALLAPAAGAQTPQALTPIAAALLPRAWRRPVTDAEVESIAALGRAALARKEGFFEGVRRVVEAALLSPHFLFRMEHGVAPDDAVGDVALSPHELATRVSYFLRGTMPDETLRALADSGSLHAHLDEEVGRLLAAPDADTLVDRFAFQWLGLLQLDSVTPDPKRFPTFTPALRASMLEETRLLVRDVFREGRDVRRLLDAPATWLDADLAAHYGMQDAYEKAGTPAPAKEASAWRPVALTGTHRAGLLGHASVLTVTSYPTRTSPVQRGHYVLATLLGRSPPPPPPGVASLEEDETQASEAEARSVRERLEQHRTDPTCASCHAEMDALGFGLETFDAIGRWRDDDLGHAIDASGTLPDGRTFAGPDELTSLLRDDPAFLRTFAEHLLTYALGRGLTRRDGPAIRKILTRAAAGGHTLEAYVRAVIASHPFQHLARTPHTP